MKLQSILKTITIKNTDTDSYLTIKLEINNEGIDLTKLNNLKHKSLDITLEVAE